MSLDERQVLEALKYIDCPSVEDGAVWQDDDFDDVLTGTEPLPISHAGGEFADLVRDVLGDCWNR